MCLYIYDILLSYDCMLCILVSLHIYYICIRVYYILYILYAIGDKTSIESLKLGLVHYPALYSKQLKSPSPQANTTTTNSNTTTTTSTTNNNNNNDGVSNNKGEITLTDLLGHLLCMSPTIQYLLQLEYIQKSGHNSDPTVDTASNKTSESAYNTEEQQQLTQQEKQYQLYIYHINNAIHKVKYALTNLHQAKQAVTGNGTSTGAGTKDYNSGIALITDALCKLKGLPTVETKTDDDEYSGIVGVNEGVEYEYLPIHLRTQLLIERYVYIE